MSARPRVLFVCVKNAGKSQMAAGLMRHVAGDAVAVSSAGTRPGAALNELSVASLREVGVDITGEHPKAVTEEMVRAADVVVTLGAEARVDEVAGAEFRTWITDEPSERGIDGIERMRLLRDDIAARVRALAAELDIAGAGSEPAAR
jgi:arsenate-mycothiol transferase